MPIILGLPASTIDGSPYGWGTWRALNWWAEEGGDNKLKVSAINISESLNWKIYSDLDMVVNVGKAEISHLLSLDHTHRN